MHDPFPPHSSLLTCSKCNEKRTADTTLLLCTCIHVLNQHKHYQNTQQIDDKLYSLVAPTIFVGVLAYLVAGVFAELFSMTTLTILQCFIADEEMFSPAERYAQNDLKEWLDAHGKKTVGKTGLAVEQKQPRKKSVNGPITATTGTTR
jgi:Plasma-membrane choline transporter